jgi:hypothetical protein
VDRADRTDWNLGLRGREQGEQPWCCKAGEAGARVGARVASVHRRGRVAGALR